MKADFKKREIKKRVKMERFNLKKLSVYLLTVFVFFNCTKRQLSAEVIVRNSIEKHGGLKNWNALKNLSFDKKVSLFLEDGKLESRTKKHHKFTFYPNLKGEISWENDHKKIHISYEKEIVTTFINDSLITNSVALQKAKKSFNAALYVISQPFNFLNKNTLLTYMGVVNLESKKAYAIKVGYANDTEASDKWFYYFDVNNFKMIGNKVMLKDHIQFYF